MTLRYPLVMGDNGLPQELQADDHIYEIDYWKLTNKELSSVVVCTPVYISGADEMKEAQANAIGTLPAIALVRDSSVGADAVGNVQSEGYFTATTGEWDVVTGDTGGLTAGTYYFLDATSAGALTTTPPTGNVWTQLVGIATSTTTMKLLFRDPIRRRA